MTVIKAATPHIYPNHRGSPSTETGLRMTVMSSPERFSPAHRRCPFSDCEYLESAQNLHLLRGWAI